MNVTGPDWTMNWPGVFGSSCGGPGSSIEKPRSGGEKTLHFDCADGGDVVVASATTSSESESRTLVGVRYHSTRHGARIGGVHRGFNGSSSFAFAG